MISAVRFRVIPRHEIDRRDKPIQLLKLPARQTHFLDANGTYHIRLLGQNFWFQMQCDGVSRIDENAYIGFGNNKVGDYVKRLKTQADIYGLYDGSIDLDTPLHVPARLASHQRAMIAYDISMAGGTQKDIAIAIYGADFMAKNAQNIENYKKNTRNAVTRANAYIYGDYLEILDKQ